MMYLLILDPDLSFPLKVIHTTAISGYRNCMSSKNQVFTNLKEAQKACFEDTHCVGVWNPECDDAKMFYTCKKKENWEEIEQTNESNPSCLYRKQMNLNK